jgi:hypothetical protein
MHTFVEKAVSGIIYINGVSRERCKSGKTEKACTLSNIRKEF